MVFTMNQRLWTKLLASLLVMTLTLTNVMVLGMFLSESYATSDPLERQETLTSQGEVMFDAYFKDAKGNIVHSIKENLDKQDITLYMAIEVKKGYLKHAKVQILGQNNTISNISLKKRDENAELIESVDEKTNTIQIKQINSGTKVILEIPVIASKQESYDISNFSKLNDVILTGKYIGNTGTESKIEKNIQIRNEWVRRSKCYLRTKIGSFYSL